MDKMLSPDFFGNGVIGYTCDHYHINHHYPRHGDRSVFDSSTRCFLVTDPDRELPRTSRFRIGISEDNSSSSSSYLVFNEDPSKKTKLDISTSTYVSYYDAFFAETGTTPIARVKSSFYPVKHVPFCSLQTVDLHVLPVLPETETETKTKPFVDLFQDLYVPSPSRWISEMMYPSFLFRYPSVIVYDEQETTLTMCCFIFDDYASLQRMKGKMISKDKEGKNEACDDRRHSCHVWRGENGESIRFTVATCYVIDNPTESFFSTTTTTKKGTRKENMIERAEKTLSVLLNVDAAVPPPPYHPSILTWASPDLLAHDRAKRNLALVASQHSKEWEDAWSEARFTLIPRGSGSEEDDKTQIRRVYRLQHAIACAAHRMLCVFSHATAALSPLSFSSSIFQFPQFPQDESVRDLFLLYMIWVCPALSMFVPSTVPLFLEDIWNRKEDNYNADRNIDDPSRFGLASTATEREIAYEKGVCERLALSCIAVWDHWTFCRTDTDWLQDFGFSIMRSCVDDINAILVFRSPGLLSPPHSSWYDFFLARLCFYSFTCAREAAAYLNVQSGIGIGGTGGTGERDTGDRRRTEESLRDGLRETENNPPREDFRDAFMWGELFFRWKKTSQRKGRSKDDDERVSRTLSDVLSRHIHHVRDCLYEEQQSTEVGRPPLLDTLRLAWICSLLGENARYSSRDDLSYSVSNGTSLFMDVALDVFETLTLPVRMTTDDHCPDVSDSFASSSLFRRENKHSLFLLRLFTLAFAGYDVDGGIVSGGCRYSYGDLVQSRARRGGSRALPSAVRSIEFTVRKNRVYIVRR